MDQKFLHIGRAQDLQHLGDRRLYRALEMLPGFLLWATLLGAIIFSFITPVWVAIFILIFDVYWLVNAFYLALFVILSFTRMRRAIKTSWTAELEKLDPKTFRVPALTSWRDVVHLVILPMYQEGAEIIGPALQALAVSRYPKENLIVVLATEIRAGYQAQSTAAALHKRFKNSFGAMLVTAHPDNLPGEIAGKGSNETWAAKEAVATYINPHRIPNTRVVVSSFDSDTQIYPQYFECLTWHYLTAPSPLRSSFQPIPLFHNNVWEAPFFSRVAATGSTIWQLFMQGNPDILETFSSHSMSLAALIEAGYWNTRVVSEDSIIFSQCFLAFNGDYRVVPLYYPVSMDANAARSFWRTAANVYKQNRRWAYGVEKIPYALFGFTKNKKIPLFKKVRVSARLLFGFWAWACASLLIVFLGWLPLRIGGAQFNATVLAFTLPELTSRLLTYALFGLFVNGALTFLLLPPRPAHISRTAYASLLFQWLFLLPNLIVFSALPSIEAQTRLMFGKYLGFFVTEKTRRAHP